MEYIRGGDAGGGAASCIFCLARAQPGDPERLVLGVYARTIALCNKYPYNSGHVLLAPARHVADPWLLTREEQAELAALAAQAIRVLAEEYGPHGFNVGMNLGRVAGAGVEDHLHVHVVPRWSGDTNFMTSVHETRVLPEALAQTHARLLPRFRALTP